MRKFGIYNQWIAFLVSGLFFVVPGAYAVSCAPSFYNDYALIIQIMAISVLVITVFILWNRRLIIEVDRRISIEKEMATRENQLIMAAQIAGMSGWELDLDTNEVTLSDLFYERLMTSAQEEGGYKLSLDTVLQKFCHPSDRSLFEKEYKKILDDDLLENRFELRLLDKEKKVISVLLEYRVLTDDASQAYYVYGYIIDISKRKQDAQALNLAQAALESTTDAIFIAEFESGCFSWVNVQACQLLGLSFSELSSLSLAQVVDNLSSEAMLLLKRRLRKKKSMRVEIQVNTSTNQKLTLEASVNLVSVEGGDFIVAYAHDISGRKQENKQLQISEERFAQGLDCAEIGIWDWEIKTGTVHWSKQSSLLFGNKDNLQKSSYAHFLSSIHSDDRKFVQETMNLTIEKNSKYDLEHRVLCSDGSERWIRATGAVIRDHLGIALNIIGVVLDITEQKKIQDEIKLKSLELQAFNKAMVGRELRMIELKEEVNFLCGSLNKKIPYPHEWLKNEG